MLGLPLTLKVTLRRHDLAAEIYHIKEPQKVPLVLSTQEIKRLLVMAQSIKVRMMLSLSYGCGLRVGEVVRLQTGEIDSAQKLIRVVQAKGRKDRRVMLQAAILDLPRQWWPERPTQCDVGIAPEQRYRFPGHSKPQYRPSPTSRLAW